MRTILRRHYFIFLLCSGSCVFAQSQRNIDSLNTLLKNNPADTNEIRIRNELAMQWRFIDLDSAKRCVTMARELSEKKDYEKGILRSHYVWAMIYSVERDYDNAIKEFTSGAEMMARLNLKKDLANAYVNLGWAYSCKINYPTALEYDLKALKLLDELKDEKSKAVVLGNIGIAYNNNKNPEKAIRYTEEALEIDLKNKNMISVARHLGNIGSFMTGQGEILKRKGDTTGANQKYRLSIKKIKEAYKIFEEQEKQAGMALQIGKMDNNFWHLGDTLKTLEYYEKALSLDSALGNKEGMSRHLGNIAWTNAAMKNYKTAETNFKRALALGYELQNVRLLNIWHADLTDLYERMGKYDSALVHYKASIVFRDSMYNIENEKKTLEAEMNFEFEKKEAVAKQESNRQTLIRNVFIAGFGVMFIMAILILRSYRIKQKANKLVSQQKELLETKNKEITDSIKYAKRIQTAHLPSNDYISKKLRELNHKS